MMINSTDNNKNAFVGVKEPPGLTTLFKIICIYLLAFTSRLAREDAGSAPIDEL